MRATLLMRRLGECCDVALVLSAEIHPEVLFRRMSKHMPHLDNYQRSYADITRLTPFAPPNPANVFYYTIDVSKPEEDEARIPARTVRTTVENQVRSKLDNPTWRCRAVTKDPKNPHRVRITYRDEIDHEIMKRVVETKLALGARILRDDLYPIRVGNVNRTAVLDEGNEVRAESTEMLVQENDTKVAKIE
ncbi:hypothetical protein NM208_g5619 [Fusarium decemcellulare]|uniref:Uncharacterized protein n=1 Tax=Fusarium decemcellulare TaxID=57161 RepID=A0ACC1SGD8_9HYPO|nr:hypothetical protein NM208_g5619 [Fusarium decemcellulare]